MKYSRELLSLLPRRAVDNLLDNPVYYDTTYGVWRCYSKYLAEWRNMANANNEVRELYFVNFFRDLGLKKGEAEESSKRPMDLLPRIATIPSRENCFQLVVRDFENTVVVDTSNIAMSAFPKPEDYLYSQFHVSYLDQNLSDHPLLNNAEVERQIYHWFQEYLLSNQEHGGVFIIVYDEVNGYQAAREINRALASMTSGSASSYNYEVSISALLKGEKKPARQFLYVDHLYDLKRDGLAKMMESGYNATKSILLCVSREELMYIGGAMPGCYILDLEESVMEEAPTDPDGYKSFTQEHLMSRYLYSYLGADDAIDRIFF